MKTKRKDTSQSSWTARAPYPQFPRFKVDLLDEREPEPRTTCLDASGHGTTPFLHVEAVHEVGALRSHGVEDAGR